MRILILLTLLVGLIAAFTGCEPTANTTNNSRMANANSNAYSNANASNSYSTTNSIANTVSNAVDKVTGNTDEDFMKAAAIGGMSEVEMGKLAASKATNPEIKKFGQMMVTDHTKANNDLKALAAKKKIEIPAEPDSSHKSTMTDLQGRSGADFDKAYVDEMVDDHEKDVKEFQNKADSAADPDVKAFATKTLPVLQKHLDAIKAIQAKMK
jgi:putative membrane protein